METESCELRTIGLSLRLLAAPADGSEAGVGFLLFLKEGAPIDGDMLERAIVLHDLTSRLEPGEKKARAVLAAIQVLFSDVPQTWAVWRDRANLVDKQGPDETATFFPEERAQLRHWLREMFKQQRTLVFLVPLEGPEHVPGQADRDWRDVIWTLDTVFESNSAEVSNS